MAGPYGQFTGYEPLPDVPGAYNFSLANGGQRTFVGPEAEALRAKIDAVPDQRTAGLDWKAAAQGAASALIPGSGLAALAASDSDAKGKADVPVSPVARAAGPTPVAAPQAAPVAATQPAAAAAAPAGSGRYQLLTTEKDGSQIFLKPGGDPRNPMDLVKEMPGRAATKGGLVQRGQTVSGAQNVDQAQIAAIEGAAKTEQDLRNESAERVNAIALRRQELMEGERRATDNQAAVQFHENTVKANEFKKLQAKYDDAEREYSAMPTAQGEREKASNSGLSGFAKSLSLALGALGAGMARTPNFAAETLERDAERRMRRDEAELRVKKDSVNMLGELRDKMGGSLELARQAYMAIDAKKTAIGYEMLAAKEKDQERASQYQLIAQQEWKGHLKWKEQLTRQAEGEISKTFAMTQGSSGSAPRRVGVSLDEAAKLGNIAQTTASTDKTRVETEKAATETKSGGKLSDTAANTLSNIDTSLKLLPGVAAASRKAGRIIAGEGEVAGYSLESSESKDYRAKARGVIRVAAKSVEGDAAAESHIQSLEAGLLSGDPEKREAAQVELTRTLKEKRKSMESVVPGAAPK